MQVIGDLRFWNVTLKEMGRIGTRSRETSAEAPTVAVKQ